MDSTLINMQDTKTSYSFSWSLKPLLYLAKFAIGCPSSFTRKSYCRSKFSSLFLCLGFFILVSNLVINGPRGIFSFSKLDSAENPDAMLQLVVDFMLVMFFVAVPLIHLSFLVIVFWSPNWTRLFSVLKAIKKEMNLSKLFYVKCRKHSVIALLYFVLNLATYIWRSSSYNGSENVADERWKLINKNSVQWLPMDIKNPFPLIASLWARMAELAITALFVALVLMASLLFEELGNRANEMNEESNVGPMKLENWRRHYVQVCQFVVILNHFFGTILLIKTALAFTISIFELNKILQTRMGSPQYYFEFIHTALRFLLEMLLPSYLLTQKTDGLGAAIYQMTSLKNSEDLQLQINTVLFQVAELPIPKITAMNVVPLHSLYLFYYFWDNALQWAATIHSTLLLVTTLVLTKHFHWINLYLGNTGQFVMQRGCPNLESYSPCYCPVTNNEKNPSFVVICSNLTLMEVNEVFKITTPADLSQFMFISTKNFPLHYMEDIFLEHRVQSIEFYNDNRINKSSMKLKIHPEAFRSSRYFATRFRFHYCDLSLLDFAFLTGFTQLRDLEFENSLNVNLNSLPLLLPSLEFIHIVRCSGLNEWHTFPSLIRGLKTLSLVNTALADGDCARILDWIISGPSNDTLIGLDLSSNTLTMIPQQIKVLQNLKTIILCGNQEPGFGWLSIPSLPQAVAILDLSSCKIVNINPDTVDAVATGVEINLSDNKLTSLESSVFKKLLTSAASVNLGSNHFDCLNHCHLAWLIVDHADLIERLLFVSYPYWPVCSDYTLISDIDPDDFDDCPEIENKGKTASVNPTAQIRETIHPANVSFVTS